MRDYAFGVEWIALNDDPDVLDLKRVKSAISVALLADLFEREVGEVAADVLHCRRTGERPKPGVRAPKKTGLTFAEEKATWHKRAVALLKKLAVVLDVPKTGFRVTSNPGGPAIWGEVSLHTSEVYLSIGGEGRVYYRACAGLEDYGTGPNTPNVWFDSLRLTSEDGMRALAREILEATEEG